MLPLIIPFASLDVILNPMSDMALKEETVRTDFGKCANVQHHLYEFAFVDFAATIGVDSLERHLNTNE